MAWRFGDQLRFIKVESVADARDLAGYRRLPLTLADRYAYNAGNTRPFAALLHYREPDIIMRRIEKVLENLIFNSRWLLAPFYFGLVFSIVVLLVKFVQEFLHFAPEILDAHESAAGRAGRARGGGARGAGRL